jgi:protein TonB
MNPTATDRGIWGEVAACVPRPRRRVLLGAIALTALLHGAVFLVTYWVELSLESWSARVAARLHQELARENEVDLTLTAAKPPEGAPPPAAKAQPPPPQPEEPPAKATPVEREPEEEPPATRAPAVAGKTVVAEPTAPDDQVADFSLSQGAGEMYAGGVTTGAGTSQTAVRGPVVDASAQPRESVRAARPNPKARALPVDAGAPRSPPPVAEGPDLSRPVGLLNPRWSCPWPREADDERIDAQTVMLRLTVDAQGHVEAARVVKEPGHGFGPAAVACARRTRFVAARDRGGKPVRAEGALVRVQFSR